MIKVNVEKAKEISHGIRRSARAEEFQPLDVKATIPAEATQAEAERQVVRDKYAAIQAEIDAATSDVELKQVLVNNQLL